MTNAEPRMEAMRGRVRVRHVAAASFVVLVAGLAAGCSSGTSSSSTTATTATSTTSTAAQVSDACKTARTRFQDWVDSTAQAIDAGNTTTDTWVQFVNSFTTLLPPSTAALTTAVAQFSGNNQKGQVLRQTAAQDLSRYQTALAACSVSRLPSACQAEFAHHQAGVTAATALQQADETAIGAIQTEQQAMRAGSSSGVSAAEHSFNAAVNAYNATVHTWSTWRNDQDTLEEHCDSAISSQV